MTTNLTKWQKAGRWMAKMMLPARALTVREVEDTVDGYLACETFATRDLAKAALDETHAAFRDAWTAHGGTFE